MLAILAIAAFLGIRFQPLAREYFVSTLQNRYHSDVELANLQISLYPTVRASGDGLVLWFNGRHEGPPLVRIRSFRFEAGFVNFFRTPRHIDHLHLEGLEIHIPPRSGEPVAQHTNTHAAGSSITVAFVLDEVVADGTSLEIAPRDPSKKPLVFDISQLTLHTIGIGLPMTFHAALTNPKPPGLVHTDGRFGPWNAEHPAATPISGAYTFRDADLSVFKGITGTLSSDGTFTGQLSRLEVQGTTDTPDFALTVGGHAVPLHTEYQATVDGSNGDTELHPVHARLGRSDFDVSGSIDRENVIREKQGARKTILLEAKTDAGHEDARLEDFLKLSVKGGKTPMTGRIRFTTKVEIPPGDLDVIDRLQLDGRFGLSAVKFTSPDVQQKIAGLSHRAQGDPIDHDPDVTAEFSGAFHLRNAQLGLPDLQFSLPGADVSLHGTYGLRTSALSFQGTVKLQATVSQMTTGFKRKLLKPIDPLFRRDGSGTVLPIGISGTRGEPSFRLDIGRIFRRNE